MGINLEELWGHEKFVRARHGAAWVLGITALLSIFVFGAYLAWTSWPEATAVTTPDGAANDLSLVRLLIYIVLATIGIAAAFVAILLLLVWAFKPKKRKNRVGYKSGTEPQTSGDTATGADKFSVKIFRFLKTPAMNPLYVVVGWFLLILALRLMYNDGFKILWNNHKEVFWYTPVVLWIMLLLLIPKRKTTNIMALTSFAILLPFLFSATVNIISGKKLGDIYNDAKQEAELAQIEKAKPTRWEFWWEKPPGVEGENAEVRGPIKPEEARIERNDSAVFKFVVSYQKDFKWHESHWYWNKVLDPEKGTWSKPDPPQSGEWFLKEMPPGSGRYVGSCTDGSLKGNWVTISLVPNRQEAARKARHTGNLSYSPLVLLGVPALFVGVGWLASRLFRK